MESRSDNVTAKTERLAPQGDQPRSMHRLSVSLFLAFLVGGAGVLWSSDIQTRITPAEISHGFVEAPLLPTAGYPQPRTWGEEITLVSWNIAKGKTEGWLGDLRDIAADAELVMLQEAVLRDEMKQPRREPMFCAFSPGYFTKQYRSGVMTLSRIRPSSHDSLAAREPLIRTPKATNITLFEESGWEQPLLVVNMHAINFTVGVNAFREQLETVAAVLDGHIGPIIFSGDLNTWNPARSAVLQELMAEHGLETPIFTPDHRVRRFGLPLDYVFVRGLEVRHARSVKVDSSDHNPLILILAPKEV